METQYIRQKMFVQFYLCFSQQIKGKEGWLKTFAHFCNSLRGVTNVQPANKKDN